MKKIFTTLLLVLIFAVGAFGQDVPVLFANGMQLAAAGQFEMALVQYNAAIKFANHNNTTAFRRAQLEYNVAVCHFRLGRIDLAVEGYGSAIRLNPDYEKAYYALGMAEAERKNWAAAEKAFLGAIAINSRNGEIWFDLGYVYLAQKDLVAAKAAFELSAKYKSVDDAVSHNNIGVILAVYGDTRRAIVEFELALRLSEGKLDTATRNLAIMRQQKIIDGKMIASKLQVGIRMKLHV